MTYTVLGTDAEGTVIRLSQSSRREGTYIIGATGQGKSSLIVNQALDDIKNELGVCVIDPHGDLTNDIISRMHKRLEDVVFVDLSDRQYVASFNLFHCENPDDPFEVENIVSAFMHVLDSVYKISPLTPQMNQYYTAIAHTLIYNPSYTLLDIPRLLTDKPFRDSLVKNIPDPHVQWFWNVFFEEYRRGVERGRDISMVVNKLDEFIKPVMKPWFGDVKRAINFRHLMDNRKLVFIKLTSQWGNLTKLLGSIIIAQLLDAAYSRRDIPLKKRKQMNIYVDEFQNFASEDFSRLFTEARKYGLGMTISHQVFEQLEQNVKATCKQAANIIVFRVSADNAKEIAGTFDCSPLPGLPNFKPLRTPVKKPIEFILEHGTHPMPAVREFIDRYGQRLVDNAKDEENWQKQAQSASRSVTYSDRGSSKTFVDFPTYESTQTLLALNSLFYRAMLAGKQQEPLPDFDTSDEIVVRMFPKLFPSVISYQAQLQAYQERVNPDQIGVKLLPQPGKDIPTYIWELENKLTLLPAYQLQKIQELEAQVTRAKKLLPAVYKRHLFAELEAVRELIVIARKEFSYYPARSETSTSYDYDYSLCTYENTFGAWDEVLAYYCEMFASVWFCVENSLYDKGSWQHTTSRVYSGYKTKQGQKIIEELDTWVLKPGIEQSWYTQKMFDVALSHRLGTLTLPQELAQQIYGTQYYVASDTPVGRRLREVQQDINRAEYEKETQTRLIQYQIGEEKKRIEEELARMNSLLQQEPRKEEELQEVIALLTQVCRELALSPVEADSGLMQEIPTEIPSTEVESRIANQLKLQQKFHARVRTEAGEYSIQTLEPREGISETELKERISRIQEDNRKKDYLRLRSEVEAEIQRRQVPLLPQPTNIPKSPTKKPPPPAAQHIQKRANKYARTVPIQRNCPNCGASNQPGTIHCMQCGVTF